MTTPLGGGGVVGGRGVEGRRVGEGGGAGGGGIGTADTAWGGEIFDGEPLAISIVAVERGVGGTSRSERRGGSDGTT